VILGPPFGRGFPGTKMKDDKHVPATFFSKKGAKILKVKRK